MLFLHVGDHTGLRVLELAAHVFELDHLAFAVVTLLIGIWAYRRGRRVEARVRIQKDRRS
jgi:hypothetical protein